ncbi:hypothetical protein NQ318_009290 [Aromia moschata]|uniref:Uncharacterized protein n=1 Tax=Aromia moschata TaxID=1265417 RepID=A0AAV8YKA8_9CUCU|nr:hypothetical protein NQ318_009290 [Aromia moschata]
MSSDEIKNLEEVLSNQLGSDKKIIEVQTTPLTAKGENFGGTLLKLDVKLKNEKDGTEEELHAVAKMLPTDEMLRKRLPEQTSVRNEMGMYSTIMPTLQEFQRKHGVTRVVDYFPEFYGGRLNLGEKGDLVDDDSVIIMENLKESENSFGI